MKMRNNNKKKLIKLKGKKKVKIYYKINNKEKIRMLLEDQVTLKVQIQTMQQTT